MHQIKSSLSLPNSRSDSWPDFTQLDEAGISWQSPVMLFSIQQEEQSSGSDSGTSWKRAGNAAWEMECSESQDRGHKLAHPRKFLKQSARCFSRDTRDPTTCNLKTKSSFQSRKDISANFPPGSEFTEQVFWLPTKPFGNSGKEWMS